MNKTLKQSLLVIAASLCILPASAQLSSNPYKFLGNITTRGNVEAGGSVPKYYTLWNQITCENESKWSSVEGSRGNFNWNGANNAFNYAKQHDFTYKFHALVWGAQYPSWLENLAPAERFAAYVNWFDHAKAQYATLPMIDVVNEAVGMHQQGNPMVKESLGGGGKTGYDWLIKAFEMAYERWPDAILIYNDYNSIQWDIDNYITLVQTLRDAGAPIDAYGNQSHDVTDISKTNLNNALEKQQNALKMPMFITELDIDKANDTQQKTQYQNVLPTMWEKSYCAGVTLWGYVLGATWVDNSGLYRDGEERPAMTWIKEYMQTDAAKNAVGPFPGTKKEASIYIRPASQKVAKGDVLPIMVRARMATKTIEKIDLYDGSNLIDTKTQAPYLFEYSSTSTGTKTLKAVVTTTDGETYERYGRIQVLSGETKREPYNETLPELPGTIVAGEFDKGVSGVSYSGVTTTVVKSRDKFSTTATQDGAWMEYTVDVKEDGLYTMDMEVASTKTGGRFHLAEYSFDNLDFLTDFTDVPNTGSATEFQLVHCSIKKYLTAGKHVFTLLVEKGGFYIKDMTFKLLPTFAMPGTVEAEDFVTNKGGSVVTINGGFAWGNAANGDYAEYSVKVNQAGKYAYEATVASEVSGSKFTMKLIDSEGNETSMPLVKVPNNGKDTYEVKTGNVKEALKEGLFTLRIDVTGGKCFVDKIKFNCTEPASGIDEVEAVDEVNGPAYNLMGVPVNNGYRGIVIKNGKKVVIK
ncbi:MAG: endo-1,4-beta-xylanase [Prevotella sp.]|nr:endo-1,4-beta-xylanase [Prevotella sp.]